MAPGIFGLGFGAGYGREYAYGGLRSSISYPGNPFTWPIDDAITPVDPVIVGFSMPVTGGYAVVGSPPTGIDVDPDSGELSGTPTDGGAFSFVVEATDTNGGVHRVTVHGTVSALVAIPWYSMGGYGKLDF